MEQPIRFSSSPAGHLSGARAWVTQRTGGVSPAPYRSLNLGTRVGDAPANVAENERRVLAALGIGPPARAVLVHGAHATEVEAPGLYPDTDALVSREPRLALALTVADCYPLAITAGPWRALAHCGWRGVAAGIVETVLRVLLEVGAPMRQSRAWIGPGIGACCYEVGPEVAARFPASARPTGAITSPPTRTIAPQSRSGGDRSRLDLGAEIEHRILAGGLPRDAILSSGECTSCQIDRFFSYRAEGPTGRMSAYLVPTSAPSMRER